MISSPSRLQLIAEAFAPCQTWVQKVTPEMLKQLITQELSSEDIPCDPILHIVSGNTPHAAFQSILRGLVIGSHNYVKLPSSGLPEFEEWHAGLPDELKSKVDTSHSLHESWLATAEAVVAYGSDETLAKIQSTLKNDQIFIPHGHKISIGIISDPSPEAARLAAKDVSLFDQLGCLSLIALYCPAEHTQSFAKLLAKEMAHYAKIHPRQPVTASISGAISNLRSLAAYQSANLSGYSCHSSPGSTEWTVIASPNPAIEPTPLYRTVFVKPIPENLTEIGPHAVHLSTIALHPYTNSHSYTTLPATRFCPLGTTQEPDIFWNADGYRPLKSLVKNSSTN